MLTLMNSTYVWRGTDLQPPKEAGFAYNPAHKLYWTKDPRIAAKLLPFATSDAALDIRSKVETLVSTLELSRAEATDFQPPAPEGQEYRPFQRAGVEFAMRRDGVLIADEMGLGKTVQAIGVINSLNVLKPQVLVVCPASLKINWRNEIKAWLTKPISVGIAEGRSWPKTDVVIINYDILHHRTTKKLKGGPNPGPLSRIWDVVIFDESHYIKNRKALRTEAALAIKGTRRLALTGTPILNKPIEIWTTLSWLDPSSWRSFWGFAQNYCGASSKNGWDTSGAQNLRELNEKLRTTVMIRRLKKDVLKELPPKVRQIVELPVTAALIEKERKALAKLGIDIDALIAAAEMFPTFEAAAASLKISPVAFDQISKIRKETALSKIPACIEFIQDALDCGHKLVVFAHHVEVVDRLVAGLAEYNPVKIYGATSMTARQEAVHRFQNDPNCGVFVGNIQAAGVGLTLTAASLGIFVEMDWVPGIVTQAEDRLHRIGQHDSVLIQHLVLSMSLDCNMAKVVVRKQRIADKALN